MVNKTSKEIIEKTKCVVPLECQKGYTDYAARFLSMHTVRCEAVMKGIDDLPVLSILITGPTGSGKSYVMSALAKAADVNLIVIDCSSLSRTGWKGTSLNDIICGKIHNKKNVQNTVVWFDEFDKLRFHPDGNIEGNAQYNFLKLYDGQITGEVDRETVTVDTRSMSFVYSGAFEGIEEIISKRTKPERPLGFGLSVSEGSAEADSTVTIDDVKEYGILAELCGRIGSIYSLSSLTEKDFRTLLKGYEGSVLSKYENLFRSYDVSLDMTNVACDYLAETVRQSKFGARAAGPIIYNLLQKTIPDIESKGNIRKIIIDYTEEKGIYTKYSRKRMPQPKEPPKPIEKAYDYSSEHFELVDDINLYTYIQTGRYKEITEKMLKLCKLEDFQKRLILSTFLKTCLLFFDYCMSVDDMTLSKIEELAQYTDKLSADKTSLFNKMVRDSMKKRPDSEKKTKLYFNLSEFALYEGYDTSQFLTSAIKEIRSRWYSNLVKTVSK